jgi:hypothetical protein
MWVMDFKARIFLICLTVIVLTTLSVLFANQRANPYERTSSTYRSGESAEVDRAVSQAKLTFQQKVQQGLDLTNGPCLDNNLMPDWVADIVHNPRAAVDNLPENECPAYLSGQAHHFVELDANGKLVRTH